MDVGSGSAVDDRKGDGKRDFFFGRTGGRGGGAFAVGAGPGPSVGAFPGGTRMIRVVGEGARGVFP